MRDNLTDRLVASLKPSEKPYTVWDTQLKGFGVRVLKNRKTFTVMRGKQRERLTIGHYPDKTLQDARKSAKALLATSAPQNGSTGFLEALESYLTLHVSTLRTAKETERILRRHFTFKSAVGKVTRADIQSVLDQLADTPSEANHAFKYLRTFFLWAIRRGLVESSPMTAMKMPYKEQSRERILTDEELVQIWNKLTDSPFSKIVRLLICTGQRRGEVAHFSYTDGLITIDGKHTKNGRTHTFPYGDFTAQYLATDLSFSGWSRSKQRLDKACGVTDWTLHDLRRTYASTHARIGTPIHIIEKLLNHVSGQLSGISGTYNRYSYQKEMREACEKYETHLKSILLA